MSDEAYWILACKVWEQKASLQEKEQLDAWGQQKGNAQKLAHFRQLWEMTAPPSMPAFSASDSWTDLESRLHSSRGRWTVDSGLFFKIAASLLLLMAAYFYLPGLFTEELLTLQTHAGEQKLVVLPDSSQVWLNANSTLTYPKTFTGSQRLVSLEGEAFFEVTKDPAKPFIIETASTETKVLGTSFNVKAEAHSPVTVTVVTGKVQVRPLDGERAVVLLPGDAGIFDSQRNTLTSSVNNDPHFMAWHNRTLAFMKTPVMRVFETLEEMYDIEIDTPSPVSSPCVFTGTFENAQEQEILEVLSASVGFEWAKGNNGHYIITHITCQ